MAERIKSADNQLGQSLVIIAIMMTAILAFLGLLIDGGRAYEGRRICQNAADSGAFSGAQALTVRTGNDSAADLKIKTTISTFAIANGAASAANVSANYIYDDGSLGPVIGSGAVPSTATGVKVNVSLSFQPFLLTVLSGSASAAVSATATAQSGPPTEMDNLMPMTLQTQTFTYGVPYQLFGNVTGSGAFQWLSYDCLSSNGDLVDYLTQAKSSGVVEVGDSVCSGPGVENSHTVNEALDAWLAKPADERIWTIPIYDYVTASGSNLLYHIVAFALFEFDGYRFTGSNKYVMGKFIKMGKLSHVYHPGQCNVNGLDGCGISLSQ